MFRKHSATARFGDPKPRLQFLTLNEHFFDKKIARRQDSEKYYFANGSMYLIRISDKKIDLGKINKIKKIIMNQINSIDIDNEDDWLIAEQILRR